MGIPPQWIAVTASARRHVADDVSSLQLHVGEFRRRNRVIRLDERAELIVGDPFHEELAQPA